MKYVFGRRNLLAGLGLAGAFFAPFVRQERARAAGKGGRFLFFHTPNGFARSHFGSEGNDATFKLRQSLAGAEAMKDHISVVRGLSNKSQHPGRPFHDQITRLLTCVSGNSVGRGEGISIDQLVAKNNDQTALNLKVYRSYTSNVGTCENISWKSAGVTSPNINDPREAYKTVFGGFMPSGTGAESASLIAQEKSMLDFLGSEINTFRGRLASEERSRVDGHLEAVRQMEKKLAESPGSVVGAGQCPLDLAKTAGAALPPKDGGPGAYDIKAFSAHGDVQASLILAAFACGARNAATLMWQAAASGINPAGGSGKADDHHNVSHGTGASYQDWISVDSWYGARFGKLLTQMKEIGILDSTVVVWGSEISQQHSHNNCTFVVAGGKDLGIVHRKTFDFPFMGNEGGGVGDAMNGANKSISDLWVSVQKACGIASDTFGQFSTGGIAGLYEG